MSELVDLDVFISSDQQEFTRKGRRLERIINNMSYLSCELLENRGADSQNTEASSINAAKKCDFYIGICGKRYSSLAQKECIAALEEGKRYLIYIMDFKPTDRDPRVTDFIEEELKARVKYHKFQNCKGLEEQIQKDLKRQIIRILRAGIDVTAERKEEIRSGEKELKDNVYLSLSLSDNKKIFSILSEAKSSYDSEQYFVALINTSTYRTTFTKNSN